MKPHPQLPTAFAELGLEIALLEGLREAGFETPTDIQREMIPLVLQGLDVMGQARTGTGKTAAFGLPIMQQLDPNKHLQAVVLVPTRELAVQVTGEIQRLSSHTQLRAVPVYGGQSVRHQIKLLGRRTHLVVATPGRLQDLLNRRVIRFDDIAHVVLDEVDRMLDIGFIDDIRRVLGRIKGSPQTIFVSATISRDINTLAREFMNQPREVNVSKDELTVDTIHQAYCSVQPWDKFRMLEALLKEEDPKLAIVFTNTKHAARKLARKLHQLNINVKEIHGDLMQSKRERVMDGFRRHKIDVLVATDLASRGIDVQNITHIINYDIPPDPQVYIHRIGRTARMGAFGKAITLVTPEEGNYLTSIEMLIDQQLKAVTFDGFTARPAREEQAPAVVEAPRSQATLFGAAQAVDVEAKPAPPKTLGSKFRPRRRRR